MTKDTEAEFIDRLEQYQADHRELLHRCEVLDSMAKQPNRSKNEKEAIGWGCRALDYLFSHEAESMFLQEHVDPETKQPSSFSSIEQIRQFWKKRGMPKIHEASNPGDMKKHLDLDVHCRMLEQMAAEYDPTSEPYQVLEFTARALIYLHTHGYDSKLLAYLEEFASDPMKASEADFRRSFLKRLGRTLPP